MAGLSRFDEMGLLPCRCPRKGDRKLDSERTATEAQLERAVPPEDPDVAARPPLWQEPAFEVIEASAEVTAYAYRR